MDEKHTVTCDDAESISVTTQNGLSRNFSENALLKGKLKSQINKAYTLLCPLIKKAYISIHEQFLHLVVAIARKPEIKIDSHFQ